ncbi:helix-loop-helix DNA-binding domain-containing transcription factor [Mucor lusitanicus]|uniref:Helix-loop-helix DNA-binding domain-containing transcription factor n=2 Tax=Mucor circinelloides f. lusitanicus TaxID=29924 RepID=A0A168GYG6_MUCCL|nr:helix-loop-helix DNA-binding domain-containing transcription factor [Mucor lusitanicus]OAC98158.1 helix-loop-helix DNA-binding domain-containing transcription factor [Mucor lusitanicus CBS 277.49]
MNAAMNNASFGFDTYNFMPAPPYTPTKMHYYDTQLYPTNAPVTPTVPTTTRFDTYDSIVAMASQVPQQPVVPSQIDMYNSMPSSPESAASSSASCSPLVVSFNASNTHALPSCVSLTEKINERIAQVNKLPDSFLPEFHQYSKETYENGGSCMKKRRRRQCTYDSEDMDDQEMQQQGISAAEMRRQVHIQSEQKRRAQIKDGFDVLRQHLPGCANKKMSKAALLGRTVQHLQHLKRNQASILTEIERLVQENEKLKSAATAAATTTGPSSTPPVSVGQQRAFI